VYAIVRAGGRQEKVAVGDVVVMDRVDAQPGATVSLPAVLVVDDGQVTSAGPRSAFCATRTRPDTDVGWVTVRNSPE